MTTITMRKLPAGEIPTNDIRDPQLKRVVMLLNQNIATLHSQLETAQKAVIELQRRK